ncbi:MAG: DEAD/DEAH box helicase [Gammaproteobacteria bacterium]|nr:DEAD/DEAH box helicase [Gammaproteobacteria bacterium]
MITNELLNKIDKHWAVLAVGDKKICQNILEQAQAKLVRSETGEQLTLYLENINVVEGDIERLATAYEMAAIEGMGDFINHTDNNELSDQFLAGTYRAFELRKALPMPDGKLQCILHILHLSALAYCGDCPTDLKHLYKKHKENIDVLSQSSEEDWSEKILLKLFQCWKYLFVKDSYDDLTHIAKSIQELRVEQGKYEQEYFSGDSQVQEQHKALRLMSLYHFAKATELLAQYMLQGGPADIKAQTDRHFSSAVKIAGDIADAQLEVLLRWLQATTEQMVSGSIWWVAQTINSNATKFIKNLAEKSKPLLELLPPQRVAIKEMGLLDPAKTAVVVDMPTSGGKTLLAQFRMLQTINNFGDSNGWIAYVAPTKALVSQLTRRLRKDFSPIGIIVEKLSGALEIDVLEEDLLHAEKGFDILVSTPEKMQLVLRNRKINRPLSLFVMDEAHNIEDENRGLRIELLLSTVKQHYQSRANFLLLMPYVPNAETLARWLAHDRDSGQSISLSTSPWKPNERIVGLVEKAKVGERVNWKINYQTLVTTPKTLHLKGLHQIGGTKPIDKTISAVSLSDIVAGCAKVFSNRGTSIVVAKTAPSVTSIAKTLYENMTDTVISDEIKLVQNFLKTEVSPDFELIKRLDKGIGVHHAKLSDEIRALMEWLAERGKLRVLCATTTIAQGINFPVASIFLQSIEYPYGKKMSYREFWNLVGRAGRIGQENVGVVGIACNSKDKKHGLINFVKESTGDLTSRLLENFQELEDAGKLDNLEDMMYTPQWEDFRCYIAHLLNEKKDLQVTINEMDQMLSNTFGYSELKVKKPQWSQKLLDATKTYTKNISDNMGRVAQADITGFSVESIGKTNSEVKKLERQLTSSDWMPDSLFGESNSSRLADIFKVMFEVKQLNFEHDQQNGSQNTHMADIAKAWINGESIQVIARKFCENDIGTTYKIIYNKLLNGGTWGVSALSQITGIDFDQLEEDKKRQINLMPSMMYYGVNNEESVLMRLNSVPRSFTNDLAQAFKKSDCQKNISSAHNFLKEVDWNTAITQNKYLKGKDCKKIWNILSGEDGND